MVRYTKFSAAAYSQPCGAPPYGSQVEQYIDIDSTDTQATLFRDDSRKEYILSFAGSQSGRDGKTDFDDEQYDYETEEDACTPCDDCKVHRGFYRAYSSASSSVKSAVQSAMQKNKGYKMTITGHSLGGGLAALSFASLKGSGVEIDKVYTFGQPRVGNGNFADYLDELSGADDENAGIYHRVTHSSDGVPQAPSQSQGYQHNRNEYFQEDDFFGSQDQGNTYRCFGQEAGDCNKAHARGFINAAHSIYSGMGLSGVAACSGGF